MERSVTAIDLARGRWPEIYRAMGIQVDNYFYNPERPRGMPCPCCGGTDRFSFDKWEKFKEFGSYICRGCGAGAGFRFMENFRGGGFRDQAIFVEELFNYSKTGVCPAIAPPSPPKVMTEDEAKAINEKLMRAWSISRRVKVGDPVWQYLVITRKLPVMRWTEALAGLRYASRGHYYRPDGTLAGTFPMMLAKVAGPDGKVVQIHRTYLTPEGLKADLGLDDEGKPLSNKKLMRGFPASGGAIRLFAATGDTLGVSEGLETAFAAHAMEGIPVWACVSASMLSSVVVPRHIKKVIIFADNDFPDKKGRRAGIEAAQALRIRLIAEGFEVEIRLPSVEGTDFHDVWSALVFKYRTEQIGSPRCHKRGSTTTPGATAGNSATA